MKTHSHAAPRTAAALTAASIAAAPLTVPFAAAQDGLFGYDGQAADDATVTETVTETEYTPPSREKAPDTDNCPQATVPPEPVSTSERVAPGSASPTPLPVTYDGPCGYITPDGFTVDEAVVSAAWMVADVDTGDVIAMKDPHGRYRPASIIKVLLALVAIDELPLDKKVTVSEESAGQEGSAVGIGAGGEYTINDLLHGLLMVSGNDASHALAQELGGDQATLEKINAKARELNLRDTYAASYSGLDAPGMSTSAWDMGLAYRVAYENGTFANIIKTEMYPFPGYIAEDGTVFEPFDVYNDNHLYLNDPDGIGGKTGYTDDAHHTFVGALDRDGRRLMAVVLDTTADEARAWEQAQRLLHESYRFTSSEAVASLDDVSADPTETGSPITDEPGTDSRTGRFAAAGVPWQGIAVFIGVLALAAVATWLSVRSRRR
ncbi:D-alanyl-D-alanine carboxypeptidase [Corynebacterium sp. CCUG 71335]|uniref:D-alanyl-D-alanine carboxypeptidase family protein n=1 Tax=Corynebacterium sp. CCUG 71335 TaxID=2823892 RepID=UPI00210CB561|nr:serine hydrolase [Corynebacterium sp. CCUG 71335]MCQ4621019.1 D-alanyl-D-alanine carboxypeptidase [Corynebacterium sp. CCUG 71335]